MNTPIVIDACTLINLLRIDEDDNFLYKHLKSFEVHIAETVYNEIRKNVFRNAISKTDEKRIDTLLPLLPLEFKLHQDEEIKRIVGNEYFEQICSFSGHTKKFNGELISSVLALVLSRFEESKVCFLTDDFPAKEEFSSFFTIQQIGLIEDSIDLLLMLHWSNSDFTKRKLENVLFDLKAEYNRTQSAFVGEIVKLKSNYKQGSSIRKIIENIADSFYNKRNIEEYTKCLKEIEKINDKRIKECLLAFPNLSKQPKLVEKIDFTLNQLKELEIYKLA